MACFLVPVTEAIITTVATKVLEKRESRIEAEQASLGMETVSVNKEPFSRKLKRLNALLWGGSALLAFEHLWHGEIQPFFPFLTAAADPAEQADMLHEMATVGVSMSILVTAAWGIATFITDKIAKRDSSSLSSANMQGTIQ